MAIRAIVFDLDGTLIDSVPDLTAALNRLMAQESRPTLSESQVAPMVGDGVAMLVRRALTACGGLPEGDIIPFVQRFVELYTPHAAELTRPYDGVVETLTRLRDQGIALAVCTNKVSAATWEILRALKLAPLFQAVVGGDDTPRCKPNPIHVTTTLDRLGVAATDAVYVGDSENDVLAAKAAGLPVVLVSYGYARSPADRLGADRVIDRFADLPQALSV